MANLTQGPTGYENWLAALRGENCADIFELQLYSDAWVTDEIVIGTGPYTFHNAVPVRPMGTFAHVITLRVSAHVPRGTTDLSQTDTSRYHGGWLADEISALASLLIGIRLRAGGVSRDFHGDDPRGRPRADTAAPTSPLPARENEWIIPRARRMHNMREAIVPLLSTYIHLTAAQAVALVRAARLYQDAIWVAEAQPELAWLLFVSAIEVVATQHQVESNVPADLLQAAYPDLYTTLARAGGGTLVAECADHLARLLRATQRFLKFTLDFLPPEPPRPDKQQVDLIPWKPQTLRPILSRIYEYRSRALHDGIPFPKPMCDAPEFAGWYHERPGGLASGTNDAAWLREDTPVLLHVFEHICRGSITGWWRSLTTRACSESLGNEPGPSAI